MVWGRKCVSCLSLVISLLSNSVCSAPTISPGISNRGKCGTNEHDTGTGCVCNSGYSMPEKSRICIIVNNNNNNGNNNNNSGGGSGGGSGTGGGGSGGEIGGSGDTSQCPLNSHFVGDDCRCNSGFAFNSHGVCVEDDYGTSDYNDNNNNSNNNNNNNSNNNNNGGGGGGGGGGSGNTSDCGINAHPAGNECQCNPGFAFNSQDICVASGNGTQGSNGKNNHSNNNNNNNNNG